MELRLREKRPPIPVPRPSERRRKGAKSVLGREPVTVVVCMVVAGAVVGAAGSDLRCAAAMCSLHDC